MPAFDGMDFSGPMGILALPHEAGVYIITTEASGGVKILGVYDGEDVNASAAENPKKGCWEKNRKDTDPVAYFRPEKDPDARQKIIWGIMQRRFYGIVCNDPLKDEF